MNGLMNCPECGESRHESNLVDEAPFVEAARDAEQLRYFGDYAAAAHVLEVLSCVRIENYLRPRWRCLDCGSCFDD